MSSSRFHYPVFLDLVDKAVLVIGAGTVGVRKIESLLEAGARVTVYDSNPDSKIHDILKKYPKHLIWIPEFYSNQSMEPYLIIILATSDHHIQQKIMERAVLLNKLVNVVDVPDKCNFIVPSIYKQGDLRVAISTGGAAPAFSKYLRKKLEKEWGAENDILLTQLSAFRVKINRISSQPKRRELWERIFDLDPIELVRAGQTDWVQKVEQWISSVTD